MRRDMEEMIPEFLSLTVYTFTGNIPEGGLKIV